MQGCGVFFMLAMEDLCLTPHFVYAFLVISVCPIALHFIAVVLVVWPGEAEGSLGVSPSPYLSLCLHLPSIYYGHLHQCVCVVVVLFSPYEARLAGGVLSHQEDHGLVVKVCIFQRWRVELVELVALLQRQEFGFVQLLQSVTDGLEDFWLLLPPVVCAQPAEHGCWRLVVAVVVVVRLGRASRRCGWMERLLCIGNWSS